MYITIIISTIYAIVTGIIMAILDKYNFDHFEKAMLAGLWPFMLLFSPFLVMIMLSYFATEWVLDMLNKK